MCLPAVFFSSLAISRNKTFLSLSQSIRFAPTALFWASYYSHPPWPYGLNSINHIFLLCLESSLHTSHHLVQVLPLQPMNQTIPSYEGIVLFGYCWLCKVYLNFTCHHLDLLVCLSFLELLRVWGVRLEVIQLGFSPGTLTSWHTQVSWPPLLQRSLAPLCLLQLPQTWV